MYASTLGSVRYAFPDLKSVMAAASPPRSGDQLAGLAAGSMQERVAARFVLADLPLARFLEEAVVPYESDEVTRLIIDSHDHEARLDLPQRMSGRHSNVLASGRRLKLGGQEPEHSTIFWQERS